MNNDELVALALQGNQEAMTQIYNDNVNRVYFLCMKLLKNHDNACDITQDTFVKAFSSLGSLQNPQALSSWILTITANLCKDFLKSSNRFYFVSENETEETALFDIEDSDTSVIPEQSVDNAETRRLVMDMIDRLPDGQRIAIILFYYNEMSIAQIADILECSESAVKARLYYGRQKIRQEVLELEKKGTKLYGAVPVLLLLGNIFKAEADASEIPVSLSAPTVSVQAPPLQGINTNSAVSAATGGISQMTGLSKIIIIAAAAVVVAGGVITAAVLLNNNSAPVAETETSGNEISATESRTNENSTHTTSSDTTSQVSSQASSDSEYLTNAEKIQFLTANYISSSTQDIELVNYLSDDSGIATILTYQLTTSDENYAVEDILGYSTYPCYFDKNGEEIYSTHDGFYQNDSTMIYVVRFAGEHDIADINIKIKDDDEYYDIPFNREPTKVESKSGEIHSNDIITIDGRQYIYHGFYETENVSHSVVEDEIQDTGTRFVLVFTPIDSDYSRTLTENTLTFDTSESQKIPVPGGYTSQFYSGVLDNIKSLYQGNRAYDLSDVLTFEIGYSYKKGQDKMDSKEYRDYLIDYLKALKISYTDGDYSFTIPIIE